MPAELKSKITLDAGDFYAVLQQVERKAEQAAARTKKSFALKLPKPVQSALGAAERGAGQVLGAAQSRVKGLAAPAVGFGAGVAAAFTGNAIAEGVADIFKLGGALTDLSDQTGISVKNLVILQKRFTDAGLEAEDAAAGVNKMQKFLQEALADPGKQGALHQLGLSLRELIAMQPEKQLEAVGKAIAKIESPSARTAASMEIFGKSGARLNRVFAGDLFTNVSAGLEKRAEMLSRNAKLFDEISDKMMGPGGLAKTFYAGVAETVAPAISQVIDALKKIDLVGIGQQFGLSLIQGATALLKAAKVVKDSGVVQGGTRLGKAVLNSGVVRGAVNVGGKLLNAGADLIEHDYSGDDLEYMRRGMFGRNRRPDGSKMTLEEMRERDGVKPEKKPARRSGPGYDTHHDSWENIEDYEVDKHYDYGVIPPRAGAGVGVYQGGSSVLPQWTDFYANKRPSMASFAERLKPTLQGALTPDMAKRVEATGLYDGAGKTLFGNSATGLNVDTGEEFRQTRKKLMDDAKYANPNATPAELNSTVDSRMRQMKDQRKADAYRASVDAQRKPAVGDTAAKDPASDAMQEFLATLEELITDQTETIKEAIAQ